MKTINARECLPADFSAALLVARLWRPAPVDGPSVIVIRDGQAFDVTASTPTVADLLDRDDPARFARTVAGEALGSLESLVERSLADYGRHDSALVGNRLLAPCDVAAIKACGVTFAVSMLERVIEEQAGGDASKAVELRTMLQRTIGTDLSKIVPGSPEAQALKEELLRRKAWSQYLEVGLGVDAEVFSKSQPMSAVGFGADVGLHPASSWNNPEPEIVLAVDSKGRTVGATLGNDVNLRDIEGRSALLLGKAKDNNASCSIGPWIRLFDERFTIDSVRQAEVSLLIEGTDGFELNGNSRMAEISRDPLDLVAQTRGEHHQYPDGFMLFLGTMFSPIKDRDASGTGFTHHMDDRVTIATPTLGSLINRVRSSTDAPPWTFGVRALYANLARRGLLGQSR